MDLKQKQKIVKIVGAAEAALAQLEERINLLEAQGKSPHKSDKQLLKSIYRALDLVKSSPFAGDCVPHELWPKEFSNLPNLFRMELSQGWRLLYYVTGNEIKVISVVFEISDHPTYNKFFGYRKR